MLAINFGTVLITSSNSCIRTFVMSLYPLTSCWLSVANITANVVCISLHSMYHLSLSNVSCIACSNGSSVSA